MVVSSKLEVEIARGAHSREYYTLVSLVRLVSKLERLAVEELTG